MILRRSHETVDGEFQTCAATARASLHALGASPSCLAARRFLQTDVMLAAMGG